MKKSGPKIGPKILLCQIREDATMKQHEADCIVTAAGIGPSQLIQLDLLSYREGDEYVRDYDAVIIGGSGDYSAQEFSAKYPQGSALLNRILGRAKRDGMPVLGICLGLQYDSFINGGEVIKANEELGCIDITLTDEGKKDPLLKDMPPVFKSLSGHNWSVTRIPAGALLLATTKTCKVQMYRYTDNPNYYCVQFHPELARRDLLYRMTYYPDYEPPGGKEAFRKLLAEAPEAKRILHNFLALIH